MMLSSALKVPFRKQEEELPAGKPRSCLRHGFLKALEESQKKVTYTRLE